MENKTSQSSYDKYLKEYEEVLFQDYSEKGVTNEQIIEIANAIKMTYSIVSSFKSKYDNIAEFKSSALPYIEFRKEHNAIVKDNTISYLGEIVENIDRTNFFELLTSKNKKNSAIIFRLQNRRDDVSCKNLVTWFKQFKLLLDTYDNFVALRADYLRLFILGDIVSTEYQIVEIIDKNTIFYGQFDEKLEYINGTEYYFSKYDGDEPLDFYDNDKTIIVDDSDNMFANEKYNVIRDYMKQFYPQYVI